MPALTVDAQKKAAAAAIAAGDFAAALAAFRSLIPEMAENPRLWFNIAMCNRRNNSDADARVALQRALICAPNHTAATHELTQLTGPLTPSPKAPRALYIDPCFAAAWMVRGDTSLTAGDAANAENDFCRAAILQPARGENWFNLSLLPVGTSDTDLSLLWLRRAITCTDGPADAYERLAATWQQQGHADKAISLYHEAIRRLPDQPDMHTNLAAALIEDDQSNAAVQQLDLALQLDPGLARARWMRAWINLSRAEFDHGYADFDAHWQNPSEKSRQNLLAFPLWRGQPLDGPLLIWGENGVGDEILFASLVKEAAQRAKAPVILECEARLVDLFQRTLDGVTVIARSTPPDQRLAGTPPVAQCSSQRLPLFLRQRWADFPNHDGFLKPAANRYSEACAAFDAMRPAPLIGISWHSGNPRTGSRKSIPLASLRRLFERFPAAHFISLQYADDGTEIAALQAAGVSNLWANPNPDLVSDLDGLAAQISALDAVVTIVGVNAHMAGALGCPGFVMMQKSPLWYWFRSGVTSPWYPSLQIAREDKIAGFAPAIEATITALQEHLARR